MMQMGSPQLTMRNAKYNAERERKKTAHRLIQIKNKNCNCRKQHCGDNLNENFDISIYKKELAPAAYLGYTHYRSRVIILLVLL